MPERPRPATTEAKNDAWCRSAIGRGGTFADTVAPLQTERRLHPETYRGRRKDGRGFHQEQYGICFLEPPARNRRLRLPAEPSDRIESTVCGGLHREFPVAGLFR